MIIIVFIIHIRKQPLSSSYLADFFFYFSFFSVFLSVFFSGLYSSLSSFFSFSLGDFLMFDFCSLLEDKWSSASVSSFFSLFSFSPFALYFLLSNLFLVFLLSFSFASFFRDPSETLKVTFLLNAPIFSCTLSQQTSKSV